ncbi:MAG: N-acetylmuramoyl-L-alanine amidase [Clostridia bacterium]|nr:N-acetylmuramoyl-L-alanine amidase [Clostridia bacterium]
MKRSLLLLLSCFLLGCAKLSPPCAPYELSATPPVYFVILDYGHGGFDCGAIGRDTGVKESDLNLLIGERVARALEDRGCFVLRTRTDADALADTKRDDMAYRGAILCTEGADCTVSIHMNKFDDRSVKGPMCYYQAGAEEGKALADCVIGAVCLSLGRDPRLANPGNNFVTRLPAVPSVLVECGFLSNPEDEQNLQDPDYQQKLADGIAEGVINYLQNKNPPDAGG